MKYSWQRQIILETIQEHKEHLSAQQIYGYARERCPHISLGTVYRNLNTLADNNMIGRVGMISGAECFDWDPNSHEHFYCRKCHKIINLDLPEGELNALIKNVPGLRIEGHCLTVTGVSATVLPLQDQSSQLVIIFSSPLFPVFVGKSFFVPFGTFLHPFSTAICGLYAANIQFYE